MASPVKTAVKDLRRLTDITGVLTKHGFHAVVRRIGLGALVGSDEPRGLLTDGAGEDEALLGEDRSETAARFRRVLEDLGPTFVKFGQVLSTRPDIMPTEFVRELKQLQANVQQMPLETVREQIAEELGEDVEALFSRFDEAPLGSASIGQVHRARTKDGRDCVVKVQRPGIQDKIRSDLDILSTIARLLEATIEEVELYAPSGIVREFAHGLLDELDFHKEAANLDEFRQNFQDEPRVTAPEVYGDLTTSRVLCMELIKAEKLSDIEPGTPRAKAVLQTLLDALVKMVIYDGFFHGDPHPGNIMVRPDDSLVFIDLGLVGRLSVAQQDEIINLIIAVLSGDVDGISRTLLRMGRPVGRVNLREFKRDVVRIRDRYLLSNLSDINVSRFVQEVMDAAQQHRIQLNSTYALLVKTAITVEGIMRHLDPDLDIIAVATPYVRELTLRRFSARKILASTVKTSMALSGFVSQIPEQMDQILMDLEGGNLTLTVRNEPMEKLSQHLNTLGTRLFLGVIASGLAVSAALLLKDQKIEISGVPLVLVVGIACAVMATLLFWWALGWHVIGGKDSTKLRLSPLMRLLRRD